MGIPSKTFIPFSDIHQYSEILVVDSFHPKGLVLSHWRGAPKLPALHDDTSTGIVLNALKADFALLHTHPYVTNNHFDVDGFLGIWSLMNPVLALQHESLLRKMALLADFREGVLESPEDHLALKLVCWINKVESKEFYAPFASYAPQQSEVKRCVPKYAYFLPKFQEVLLQPEAFEEDWREEYEQVVRDWEVLKGRPSGVYLEESIRLLVVESPEPLHYYALFGQSAAADMVLCCYSGNRYELEYKYTTWIDTAHRTSYPRLDLQPLAQQLNQLEKGAYRWGADKVTDTGPILRLQGRRLSKEQRFDHPRNRPIYSSSLSPSQLQALVIAYFTKNYQRLSPRTAWTWPEIRKINKQFFSATAINFEQEPKE